MANVKFLFEIYNPNPYAEKGKKHDKGDCVVRAICKATGLSWEDVYTELYQYGLMIGDFGNSKLVYGAMLKDRGFGYESVKRTKGKKAPTVESFCKEHTTGTYILRLAHHITTIVDGVCYDTWYPQDCTIYGYWIKK